MIVANNTPITSATTSFTLTVNDGTQSNSSSATVTGIYPYFYGFSTYSVVDIFELEKFNKIDKNIIAIIDINSQESIEIYFNTKEMNITGWKIKNYDKSSLEFLMKNISININTNEKFEIPN